MGNFNDSANMATDMIFKFIKERMKDKNISPYRISKITGISESVLSRNFSRETEMSLSNFIKICNAMEIDVLKKLAG